MNFPPVFAEGRQLSAAELNAAFAEVARLLRITAEPPLDIDFGDNGPTLRLSMVPPFFARITGQRRKDDDESGDSGSGESGSGDSGSGEPDPCKSSWIENVSTLESCGLYDAVNGLEGFIDDMPAISADGDPLEENELVRLHLGTTGDHYIASRLGEETGSGSGSGDGNDFMVTCNEDGSVTVTRV